jgi:hypothetical protein
MCGNARTNLDAGGGGTAAGSKDTDAADISIPLEVSDAEATSEAERLRREMQQEYWGADDSNDEIITTSNNETSAVDGQQEIREGCKDEGCTDEACAVLQAAPRDDQQPYVRSVIEGVELEVGVKRAELESEKGFCDQCKGKLYSIIGMVALFEDGAMVHTKCIPAYLTKIGTPMYTCAHCRETICNVPGKFEGNYLSPEGDDEVRVHRECFGKFRATYEEKAKAKRMAAPASALSPR